MNPSSNDQYEDSHERKISVCLRCETDYLNHAKHPNNIDYVNVLHNRFTGRYRIIVGNCRT